MDNNHKPSTPHFGSQIRNNHNHRLSPSKSVSLNHESLGITEDKYLALEKRLAGQEPDSVFGIKKTVNRTEFNKLEPNRLDPKRFDTKRYEGSLGKGKVEPEPKFESNRPTNIFDKILSDSKYNTPNLSEANNLLVNQIKINDSPVHRPTPEEFTDPELTDNMDDSDVNSAGACESSSFSNKVETPRPVNKNISSISSAKSNTTPSTTNRQTTASEKRSLSTTPLSNTKTDQNAKSSNNENLPNTTNGVTPKRRKRSSKTPENAKTNGLNNGFNSLNNGQNGLNSCQNNCQNNGQNNGLNQAFNNAQEINSTNTQHNAQNNIQNNNQNNNQQNADQILQNQTHNKAQPPPLNIAEANLQQQQHTLNLAAIKELAPNRITPVQEFLNVQSYNDGSSKSPLPETPPHSDSKNTVQKSSISKFDVSSNTNQVNFADQSNLEDQTSSQIQHSATSHQHQTTPHHSQLNSQLNNQTKNTNIKASGSRKITDYWNGQNTTGLVGLPSSQIPSIPCSNAPVSLLNGSSTEIIRNTENSENVTGSLEPLKMTVEPIATQKQNKQLPNPETQSSSYFMPIRPETVEVSIQTNLRGSTIEKVIQQNSEIDELRSSLEEQRILVLRQREMILKHDVERKHMLEILKIALIDQARTERKQAREKTGRDRMRLGYLTRSSNFSHHGSSQDLWTNGTWLELLEIKRQSISDEKEDIERQRKLLSKKKPNRNPSSKERAAQAAAAQLAEQSNSLDLKGSNSDPDSKDAIFARPRDPAGPLTYQEHYEQDEILKIRTAANKRDENEYQLDMERFERERSLHIRELKRISNEDNSKYNNFLTLNERYIILNLLGKGGFSEVYRAFDLQQQIYVAVKIHHLNKDWSDQKKLDYSRHANRECEIQMRIDHPRIVKLFDTFELDMNTFCTVMEFCQGRDLDHYLKDHKTISEKEARSTIMQVVNALKYLNQMEKPVIHYDLKPGNILLCADSLGNIKVTDFGLSKQLDNCGSPSDGIDLTSQGAGTYWYLQSVEMKAVKHTDKY